MTPLETISLITNLVLLIAAWLQNQDVEKIKSDLRRRAINEARADRRVNVFHYQRLKKKGEGIEAMIPRTQRDNRGGYELR